MYSSWNTLRNVYNSFFVGLICNDYDLCYNSYLLHECVESIILFACNFSVFRVLILADL